ncbi:hypothetical protein FBZ89_11351 [Nitrospirillum amazonense]|uniref:Uncharacterized protein n=1 Tax=Nitrospirillum amazonense TaxID=28077 RepID=A0A560F4U7_9PROT|nr:hypothetical protein [Nitrospirillum amazonense]TWB16641.1 hypothetical protein FBZ89_11351 [Nitrospirillum amazonense]
MVRFSALLVTLLLAAQAPVQAKPTSFVIKRVHVEQAGIWQEKSDGDETRERCARFHLSDKAATRWFAKAKEVTEHAWREELDWTQCFAKGTLTTADGKTYAWDLDRSGRGQVKVSDTVSTYLSGPELPFAK